MHAQMVPPLARATPSSEEQLVFFPPKFGTLVLLSQGGGYCIFILSACPFGFFFLCLNASQKYPWSATSRESQFWVRVGGAPLHVSEFRSRPNGAFTLRCRKFEQVEVNVFAGSRLGARSSGLKEGVLLHPWGKLPWPFLAMRAQGLLFQMCAHPDPSKKPPRRCEPRCSGNTCMRPHRHRYIFFF